MRGIMTGVSVRIDNITKRFGSVVAVDNLSLEIQPGELFILLGPSGCGKTTLLRTIAGFHLQDNGSIYFDGKQIDLLPPHKRNTGMVFQSYAVFPFMNVFDNVAYGLKARKIPKEKRRKRTLSAIELVRLQGFEKRRPDQLSGGQQQRVAVARAIAIEPQVLLMDEPLSNLDAKLRVEMRADIRRLQKKLGITMIYVTHDQEEALAISDKIAVMEEGRLVQVASPWEIYNKPVNPYVANFIGVTNFFECQVISADMHNHNAVIHFQGKELKIPYFLDTKEEEVMVSLRPEALEIISEHENTPENDASFTSKVFDLTYIGAALRITAETPAGEKFQVAVNNPNYNDLLEEGNDLLEEGKELRIKFSIKDIIVFPKNE
jgi:iron(III) transport system ATP-binding protein